MRKLVLLLSIIIGVSAQQMVTAQILKEQESDVFHFDIDKNSSTKAATLQQNNAHSDVDFGIPSADEINEAMFVIIIANEDYRHEVDVPFALNDGRIFKEYCRKTLGIPEKHIRLLENATLNDLRYNINWITNVMKAHEGDISVIFYYAGHGVPDESSQRAFLLPVDGYASDCSTGMALDNLYSQLGEVTARSLTYFIDACFSGSKRENGMLASARGVAIKAKKETPQGNSVSFTATTGDQTAYPYTEKGHGMFTYFLLKKLKETKGDVSYRELAEYITKEVTRLSAVNGKVQTPTINASVSSNNNWESWKLNSRP